jgi:hypothetical protein
MAKKKMTSSELTAVLSAERYASLSSIRSSRLTEDRLTAMDFYLGHMERVLPTIVGRSTAVSTDVADTIEGLMPSLMDIFCGSEQVVKFEPTRADDEDAAEQETDFVNHHFLTHGGFLTLYSFIKDALLSKLGVVKIHWIEETIEHKETYFDQDEQTYQFLISQPNVEVIEHSEHPDPYAPQPQPQPQLGAPPPPQPEPGEPGEQPEPSEQGEQAGPPGAPPGGPGVPPGAPPQLAMPQQPAPPPMLHDVTLRCTYKHGYAKCEPVPPEEFGISRAARSIEDCGYCFHEVVKFEHELIDQGYDAEQLKEVPTYPVYATQEVRSRDTVEEATFTSGDSINEANRRLLVTEHNVQRVTTAGETMEILKRDGKDDIIQWDVVPFAAMTPVIMTHRVYGRSIADLVMDIQKIKTALMRALLDNAYIANNPRTEVSESHASENTLDDLLVSRPGGVVRTRQPGGLNVLMHPPIGGHVFPMLEYMDTVREWRTGVTRQGQGIDAQALQNQSATAVAQAMTASQARMKLIARIFAETGIKDMFKLLHHTLRSNGTQAETVKLRGKWTMINPRDWAERNNMTINVGLGTGGRAEQLQNHMLIVQAQTNALQAGLTNLVTMQNLHNSAKRLVQLTGGKNPDEYFTDPATQPPPQPKPDPKVMELQAQQQLDQQHQQAEAQRADLKTRADIALAERKFQLDAEARRQEMAQRAEEHRMNMAGHVVKAATQIKVKQTPDGVEQSGPDPQLLREMAQHFGQPQPRGMRIVRDAQGRVSHTEPI